MGTSKSRGRTLSDVSRNSGRTSKEKREARLKENWTVVLRFKDIVLEDKELAAQCFRLLLAWAKSCFEDVAGDDFSSLLAGKVLSVHGLTKAQALGVCVESRQLPGVLAAGFRVRISK